MAPREATGMFPDQYLTFEYDTVLPMGPPAPHEPQPVAVDELPPQQQQQQQPQQAQQPQQQLPATAAPSERPDAVDPLSIDPTGDNHIGHSNNNNNSPSSSSTTLESSSVSLLDRRPVHPLPVPSPLISHQVSEESSDAGSAGMRHWSHYSRRNNNNNNSSNASTNNANGEVARRHRVLEFQSVLDTAASMEEEDDDTDDEDDNQVPRLERTFESVNSSFLNQSSSESHVSLSMSPTLAENTQAALSSSSLESAPQSQQQQQQLPAQSLPRNNMVSEGEDSSKNSTADASETSSVDSSDTLRMIYRNTAFDGDDPHSPRPSTHTTTSTSLSPPASPNSIMLSFGPNTTVADLKYFAERGCIVALLQALTTPRLVTLGTRMLADYAKMSHRRVAVASNRRILEFVQTTMVQTKTSSGKNSDGTTKTADDEDDIIDRIDNEIDDGTALPLSNDWLGREYAVETVRSLTATEESDAALMGTTGLLGTLALVARGGPFVAASSTTTTSRQLSQLQHQSSNTMVPLASDKARLHACIAIMNLSCGKANKIEIAKLPDVLEAMRDVMVDSTDEARLKATTCIKNLSNADANDAALLVTPGLLEALGHVAAVTCSPDYGATPCTTNACLALMNLSISKSNKHKVFRTPGVMDALMTVLERTTAQGSSVEARIKACSALSNLAIGYDNKIPMFHYPGFVDSILNVIQTDTGEARTKACSILWSFAAEMKNQVPVVQHGRILPVLVRVAEEDGTTEARFKCVAALTLLAESLKNAIPLLQAGALAPLMDILHEAGPDPTQWKGQTASWCVGFLMNIAQSDEAVPTLRESGVVELLAPLLTLDHYQSLKAAMAVTFCCRYDEGDECYDLLRKTENVIPKIISLLHNTLSGRGGNGYKYGVFTLRSSVGCIDALASGPDFMREQIATGPVYESLLRVVHDFCVDGGTPGAIVGGGRDDALSATLAVRALQSLTEHLIPITGCNALPFPQSFEDRLLVALEAFETCSHNAELKHETKDLASDAKRRIQGGRKAARSLGDTCHLVQDTDDVDMGDVASLAGRCCGFPGLPGLGEDFLHALAIPSLNNKNESSIPRIHATPSIIEQNSDDDSPVRTFLLADEKTGRRFVVPTDPTGGRLFHDSRVWCYRRGRFCLPGEEADPSYVWSADLQQAYEVALANQED